jgi:hypothetical protein
VKTIREQMLEHIDLAEKANRTILKFVLTRGEWETFKAETHMPNVNPTSVLYAGIPVEVENQ